MNLQKRIMFVAAAGLVAALGLSAAPGARPAPAPLLRPLSDADQTATHESGCQLSFNTRGGTLVYAIGHDFMLRTRAGRAVCRIRDDEFSALSEGGSRTCGGVRVTIRRTGRSVGNEASDSSSAPASLTATAGGRTWGVRGYWGTAC